MTSDFASPPPPARAPSVVFWYKVYVVANVVMYLVIAALLAAVAIFATESFREEIGPSVLLLGMAGACGILAIAYFASLFFPRRPWAWVYDLVVICLGFTGCFTLPFSIVLLVFWIKPEAKSWFGTN
jgi:hypothetical protein